VEHRFVLGEEAVLAELFGRPYLDYAERVPRYVGFLKRHHETPIKAAMMMSVSGRGPFY
jgi:hypothetical protein